MELSLAFGGFAGLLAAWMLVARRQSLHVVEGRNRRNAA
jgi:hypothetical protein